VKWLLKQGNILDEAADVLVCSANPWLDLSGGVGADLLARHGAGVQAGLQDQLRGRDRRFVPQGEVVATSPVGLPWKAVLHAVAVDGFYHTSPEMIQKVVRLALEQAASLGARKVALAALATGHGDISLADFAQGIQPLVSTTVGSVEEVCICLVEMDRVKELSEALPELVLAGTAGSDSA